jgi:hypothetical protein
MTGSQLRKIFSNVAPKLHITAMFVVINTDKNKNQNGPTTLRKTMQHKIS